MSVILAWHNNDYAITTHKKYGSSKRIRKRRRNGKFALNAHPGYAFEIKYIFHACI